MPSRYHWYLLASIMFCNFPLEHTIQLEQQNMKPIVFSYSTSRNKSTITVECLHIRSCGQTTPIHTTSVTFKSPSKPEQEQGTSKGTQWTQVQTCNHKGGPRKCGTSFIERPHKAPRDCQRIQDSRGCPKSTKARNMYPKSTK